MNFRQKYFSITNCFEVEYCNVRLTNERTNYVELIPPQRAHSFPATQEVISILGDTEIKHFVQKFPPKDPSQSNMNPEHIIPSYIF